MRDPEFDKLVNNLLDATRKHHAKDPVDQEETDRRWGQANRELYHYVGKIVDERNRLRRKVESATQLLEQFRDMVTHSVKVWKFSQKLIDLKDK